MLPNRFRISQIATEALKQVKTKTGLTPNILCRFALALSLRDGEKGGVTDVDTDGSEFNTPTLFGEYHLVYEAAIHQVHGPLKPKDVQRVVANHIEVGVERLKRVSGLGDLLSFTPLELRK